MTPGAAQPRWVLEAWTPGESGSHGPASSLLPALRRLVMCRAVTSDLSLQPSSLNSLCPLTSGRPWLLNGRRRHPPQLPSAHPGRRCTLPLVSSPADQSPAHLPQTAHRAARAREAGPRGRRRGQGGASAEAGAAAAVASGSGLRCSILAALPVAAAPAQVRERLGCLLAVCPSFSPPPSPKTEDCQLRLPGLQGSRK